ALRGATPDPVNVSIQGDLANLPVERMTLRDVTVHSALRAAMAGRADNLEFRPDGVQTRISLEPVASGPSDWPVYIISRHETGSIRMPDSPTQVTVLSIQRLVTGPDAVPPEVVL